MTTTMPTTDVIRDWCAREPNGRLNPERLDQFEAWLEHLLMAEHERTIAAIRQRIALIKGVTE